MTAYRIYGRQGVNGRFRPLALDVSAGAFVGNLIYATLFHLRAEADKVCQQVNELNPDFEFEVRTVRNA